jgi:small GTP-binding protein
MFEIEFASEMNDYNIVVVGCSGVGKSALIKYFIVDGDTLVIDILDTSSDEGNTFLRMGQGFVLMFSITLWNTFREIISFRDQILHINNKEIVPMVLVGNKADLGNEREVSQIEGSELARAFSVPFFETSTKSLQNVTETFFELVRQIRNRNGVHFKPLKTGKKNSKCELM